MLVLGFFIRLCSSAEA